MSFICISIANILMNVTILAIDTHIKPIDTHLHTPGVVIYTESNFQASFSAIRL
jgi:hypothetical protein